jgi:hypothetical protein
LLDKPSKFTAHFAADLYMEGNVVSALPVLVSAYFYAVKLVLVGLKMARVWP